MRNRLASHWAILLMAGLALPLAAAETTLPAASSAHPSPAITLNPTAVISARKVNDPLAQSRGSWQQSYADQWGLFSINLLQSGSGAAPAIHNPAALIEPQNLQPVVVALIDSGVDYTHPDLPPSRLWRNPNEQANGRDDDGNGLIDDLIGWDFVNQTNNPWDDHGHGTHIAGVIAAENNAIGIAGIAPNVRLMVLKVVDASGHASGSHVAMAIRYAVDQGAKVIHLSLGGARPTEVEVDALEVAVKQGVLVVSAAGNQAQGDGQTGYQQSGNILLVGALAPDQKRAAFSDWGPQLDLLAPGVDILSLRARGSDFLQRNGRSDYQPEQAVVAQRYYRATGSSFAAPFVTATAALLLGREPELTSHQVQRILQQSAQDLGPAGQDQTHGYGMLDLAAALAASADHFVDARLERAEIDAQGQLLVHGTADADQFYQARIEYGFGEQPSEWRALLPQPLQQPVRNWPLLRLDLGLIPRNRVMTLRLTTEHRDGSQRQSRMQLQLPGGPR